MRRPARLCCAEFIVALAIALASMAGPCDANGWVPTFRSFNSLVEIHPDGSIEVHERITLRTAGDRYRLCRAIERSPGGWGDIEVIEVLMNGAPVDWQLAGDVICFGDEDKPFAPGHYEIVLHFLVPHQVEFGDELNRLEWSVTGPPQPVAINQVSVTVVTRAEMRIDRATLWAPKDTEVRWLDRDHDNHISLVTGHVKRGANLLLDVELLPGMLVEVDEVARLFWRLLRSNVAAGIAAILATLVFHLYVLWRGIPTRSTASRDGDPLSPAELGFLARGGFDAWLLQAAILNLVAKGHAELKTGPNGPVVVDASKTRRPATPPAADEAVLAATLFRHRPWGITLTGMPDEQLVDGAIALRAHLYSRFVRHSPINRWRWLAGGLAIATLGALAVGATSAGPAFGLWTAAALCLWAIVLFLFAMFSAIAIGAFRRGERGLTTVVMVLAPVIAFWLGYRTFGAMDEAEMLLGLGSILPLIIALGTVPLTFALHRPRLDLNPDRARAIATARERADRTRDRMRATIHALPGEAAKPGGLRSALDPFLPVVVALDGGPSAFDAVPAAVRIMDFEPAQQRDWREGNDIADSLNAIAPPMNRAP